MRSLEDNPIGATLAPTNQSEPIKLVGALISGLSVLKYLIRHKEPASASQIARDLELNPSTCFNILKTLVHEELVFFEPDRKTYNLSLGIVAFTRGLSDHRVVQSLVRQHMKQIAEKHTMTITLWEKLGDERMVLTERADVAASVQLHMPIGQRLPLYVAGVGRCMAAYSDLSKGALRLHFNALHWQNKPEFEDYLEAVEEARGLGYAVDRDNFVRGITTVAAPIFLDSPSPSMAISAVGLSGQMTPDIIALVGEDLVSHCKAVTRALAERAA